jgi:hypothetical protein
MFEQSLESQKKNSRGRLIKIVGVTSAIFLVVISVTIYVSRQRASEVVQVVEPYRAGAPEFDSYSPFIELEQQDHDASENMLRQVQVLVRGILFNNGDRTLTQVEVRAVVYDAGGNEIGERVSMQVPKVLPELLPGESMLVQVNVNTIPAGNTPAAARVFLHGLRLKKSD